MITPFFLLVLASVATASATNPCDVCRGWPNVPEPNWCIAMCFPHVTPSSSVVAHVSPVHKAPSGPSHPATITSVSGLKTVKAHNSAWTANTVVTTTSPGGTKQTVVPVLVGAAGAGILIFGLPAVAADVPFALPGIVTPFTIGPKGVPGDEPVLHNNNNNNKKPNNNNDNNKKPSPHSAKSTAFSSTHSSHSISLTASPSSTPAAVEDSCAAISAAELAAQPVGGEPDTLPVPKKFRRGIAGFLPLGKRALNSKPPVTAFTPTSGPVCSLTKAATIPQYFAAQTLDAQAGNAHFWYVKESAGLNAVPVYKAVEKAALNVAGLGGSAVQLGGNSNPNGNMNVDHVCKCFVVPDTPDTHYFECFLSMKSV